MNDQTYELIDRYFRGELTPAERRSLEERRQSEPELAEAMDLWQLTREAGSAAREAELKAELMERGRSLRKEAEPVKKTQGTTATVKPIPVRPGRPWWWMAAASLLLLFALFWFLREEPADEQLPATPVALYERYYQPLPSTGLLSGDSPEEAWQRIVNAYGAGDCAAVLRQIEPLLLDTAFQRPSRAYLLQGTCLLRENRPDEAVDALGQVPPAAASLYREAQWYTALAHLRRSDAPAASALLRQIAADPQNGHREEAGEILEAL